MAQHSVGPHARRWAKEAGISNTDLDYQKLQKTLSLITTGFLYKDADQFKNQDKQPPIPEGGSHPYDWDSIRTAEEMLGKCEGGYCGTFALSAAALLRAGGISTENIRVVGAVNAVDYLEICPGKKGQKRKSQTQSSASGHVYVLVKLKDQWHLVNPTHNPLYEPLNPKSSAFQTYQSLLKGCMERYNVKQWPSHESAPSKKFLECLSEAQKEGRRRLELTDFEIVPYLSPEELNKKVENKPVEIPVDQFPSLSTWMRSEDIPAKQIVFGSWSFEEFPKHTFHGRLDLIASGELGKEECRWSSKEVQKIVSLRNDPAPPSSSPGKSKQKSQKAN